MNDKYWIGDVYYIMLKGEEKRNILADECEKKKILDILDNLKKQKDFRVISYCVLDYQVEFIIDAYSGLLKGIIDKLIVEYTESYNALNNTRKVGVLKSCYFAKLNGIKEIMDTGIQMHIRPLHDSIVKNVEDYWWSSYRSYQKILGRGASILNILDGEALLRNIDIDKKKALRIFMRLHKEKLGINKKD
jgi:hypothetical protein